MIESNNYNIIPLASPDIQFQDIENVVNVLKSGMLVQGNEVLNIENKFSNYFDINYVSMVANGTASLHLALIALGVGIGDEVIIPAFSYVATANVVELVGAKCIFVDINLQTFNIDETKIVDSITAKTKVIIPVHEFGLCANMDRIMEIAKEYNLYVIEDAACAIGSTYNGKHSGTFGDFGSFSFHPRKSITCGEGGCLITSDALSDKTIKTLRNHGIEPNSAPMNFIGAGFNYRMTDFQAALLSGQLERLQKILSYKSHLASIYHNEVNHSAIRLPFESENTKHSWQTFHILFETKAQRDNAILKLKEKGVMTNYGAQCIPELSYYKKKYNFEAASDYSNSFKSFTCGLAIPIYEKLSERQVNYISKLLNNL